MNLKADEYSLLQKSKFLKKFDSTNMVVKSDNDNQTITITFKGSKEESASEWKNEILEELINHYEKEIWHEFDFDFFGKHDMLKKVNEVLSNEEIIALLGTCKDSDKVYCFKHVKENINQKEIMKMIHVREKDVGGNKGLFKSDMGKHFLSELEANCKAPCQIGVRKEGGLITVKTFEKEAERVFTVMGRLEEFCRNNESKTADIPFPSSLLKYAEKYCQQYTSVLEELNRKFVDVVMQQSGISITGLESEIVPGKKKLEAIRNSINTQEKDLHHFGINEYLTSSEGEKLLEEVGSKHFCLLTLGTTLPTSASSSNSDSVVTMVASCQLDNLTVKFVLGDITSLRVGVIVNPIDYKRQCRKGMNLAIVQNGGKQIQDELDGYGGLTDTGTIIETKAGSLPCSSIYHMILKKDDDANNLLSFVRSCLRKADQEGHKSIAFPFLGCGRFRMPQVGVCTNIANAVKKHAEEDTSVNEVIICDINRDLIKTILGRFKNVKEHVSLKSLSDADDSSDTERLKSGNGGEKVFGTVKLTMKQGDILQESCDAIACAIKENMKLSSGGGVSKSMVSRCGSALQTECDEKAQELLDEGVIVTGSHGLSCQANIFVNMTKYSRHWGNGVKKVLSLADEKGFTSIALPAFGTGSKRADVQKLKSSILQAIETFGKKKPQSLKDVRLVVFDKEMYKVFLGDSSTYKAKGKSAAPTSKVVSKAAQIQVVFKNPKSGMDAVKELEQKCKNNFKTDRKQLDIVKDLSDEEIRELTVTGLEHQVEVSIHRDTGEITFKSFKSCTDMWHKFYSLKDKKGQQDLEAITTDFKWQFMRKNRWVDFDQSANIKIEKAYKKSEDSCEIEDSACRKYRIVFKDMKEYRIRGTSQEEITTINRHDLLADRMKLPHKWADMGNDNLKIVQIPSSSAEYQNVEGYFKRCGASVPVKKIERIQNIVLYQQYAAKKKYFEKANPEGTENEKKLFHGTDPAAIANINESGFNRSFCGKNATVYGNGVYFAEESSYSVNYAKPDGAGNKVMYLAKVLVGVSCPSQSGMSTLPNKPGTHTPYDSGRGPKMFIIYHDCQAYPEYMITF